MSKLKSLSLLVVSLAAGIFLVWNSNLPLDQERKNFINLPPPEHIEQMTFGYNENVADSLWLRLIQDIDYCDAVAARGESGSSRGNKELCHSELGWSYKMLEAITDLTPQFRMPYNHGATVLSVSIGDKEGARRIFERGIKNFPSDWSLQFRAAYHYLYELENRERAAELLQMAGYNGAPSWVYALSARLYTAGGRSEIAKAMLENVIEQDPDSKFVGTLKNRLDQLNEIIAKEKENEKRANTSAGKKSH